jgi:hypothetical protein
MNKEQNTENKDLTANFGNTVLSDVLIRVYSGVSVEDKCRSQLHPLNEAIKAKEIVDLCESIDCYSNSTDFIQTIKYYAKSKNINTEFFLDGESFGSEIEPLFEDFNKSFDFMDGICKNIS